MSTSAAREPRHVAFHHLLSQMLHSSDGERVGRIEEMRAERDADGWNVTTIHVGAYGALERLSAGGFARTLLKSLGRRSASYTLPWHVVDLRDAHHPPATLTRAQLEQYRDDEQ